MRIKPANERNTRKQKEKINELQIQIVRLLRQWNSQNIAFLKRPMTSERKQAGEHVFHHFFQRFPISFI